jgi:hypothetical protein
MLFQATIYLMATISLLIGTLLTFDLNEISNYFYLIGTSLFVLNSTINFNNKYKEYRKSLDFYPPLIFDEHYQTV